MRKFDILFVCSGNTCRSPTAEMYCKHAVKQKGLDITCSSAGLITNGGQLITRKAKKILTKNGIPVDLGFRSRHITRDLVLKADIILCMEESHVKQIIKAMPDQLNKVFRLTEAINDPNDVEDPMFGGISFIKNGLMLRGSDEADFEEEFEDVLLGKALPPIKNKIVPPIVNYYNPGLLRQKKFGAGKFDLDAYLDQFDEQTEKVYQEVFEKIKKCIDTILEKV